MLWIKAFHVIAVVAWFSGLFYLPRLYVYHATTNDQLGNERFKVMEYKLYRYIMTPALLFTVFLGIWMIALSPSYYLHAGWMHAKLTLVIALLAFHGYCGKLRRDFAENRNSKSERFYRWFNEIPTILLTGIVILVVVKP